jgi:predicted alpha/beta-hydrolase family hydrolase
MLHFLFAPGAGAPSSSEWMQRFAQSLEQIATTRCFDYPYQVAGKRLPDPLPRLIQAHATALSETPHPEQCVLIGKSMGARIGCHVALQASVRGLVCFGYPLLGQGKQPKLRDEVLRKLQTPVMFVQGTKDPLCPLPLLESVRQQMTCPSELYVVQDADHSLKVSAAELRRSGTTQPQIEAQIFQEVRRFCAQFS